MHLGFRQKGNVLCLKKTLGNLRQNSRMFWEYLTNAMQACGMRASGFDPCMFIDQRVVAVDFVDGILFQATDEKYINDTVKACGMGASGFDSSMFIDISEQQPWVLWTTFCFRQLMTNTPMILSVWGETIIFLCVGDYMEL